MRLLALGVFVVGLLGGDDDARFGFGREPTEAEIDELDIDVRPDGTGLPPGKGTVAEGRELYYQLCASCHGVTGTEGPNDILVGREPREGFAFGTDPTIVKTVGNYWPYASTLYDYTNRAMPFDEPGSLEPNEVYSLVAFILFMNELIEEDVVMDSNSLPEVAMPARDRFVPDNRSGGPELK
jgi:cytochrome c